jgi:uncharacterized protein (TIGR02284 family)
MDESHVRSALNGLIEVCMDGERGFHAAAESVGSQALREELLRLSTSCARGAAELQACVQRHGGKPETSGSATGTVHRGWIHMKAVLTAGDGQAILAECERGETAALQAYEEAAKLEWPDDVREVVERQREGVRANLAHVRALREQRYGRA